MPGSENLFLAGHADGSLIVYDKERDDATFVSEDQLSAPSPRFHPRGADAKLHVVKSVNSSNQKSNPVAYWKLAAQQINAFAFSPDSQHLAVVSEGGSLQVVDYLKEEYADIDVGRVSVKMAHHPSS